MIKKNHNYNDNNLDDSKDVNMATKIIHKIPLRYN